MAFQKERIRLAAFDLDGTIFDRGEMMPGAREAIIALHQSGVETVIATGRHPFHLPDGVTDIPCFRYAIGSNGAMVADIRTRQVFSIVEMEAREARRVTEAMLKLTDLIHVVYRENGVITRSDIRAIESGYTDPARMEKGMRELRKLYLVADTPEELIAGITEPVIKLGVRVHSEEEAQQGAAALRREIDNEVAVTDNNMIEVTPKGVSKAAGLAKLCSRLGIAPEECIAFGDSGNDIAAMEWAGYSVAMGNATEDVKEAAEYVTDTAENGGVARAIKALFGV